MTQNETETDRFGTAISRDADDIEAKIDELRAYNDYSHGPRGDNLKYKHQGWIDALRWVLGSDLGEEP